jgi:hypothetical protein
MDQELIETIEGLLARAKDGSLLGIAYVAIRTDNVMGTGWDGAPGTRARIAEGIMVLSHRYAQSVVDEGE